MRTFPMCHVHTRWDRVHWAPLMSGLRGSPHLVRHKHRLYWRRRPNPTGGDAWEASHRPKDKDILPFVSLAYASPIRYIWRDDNGNDNEFVRVGVSMGPSSTPATPPPPYTSLYIYRILCLSDCPTLSVFIFFTCLSYTICLFTHISALAKVNKYLER